MLVFCLVSRFVPVRDFLFDNEAARICSELNRTTRSCHYSEYILIELAWRNYIEIVREAAVDKDRDDWESECIRNQELEIQDNQSGGFRW